MKRASINTLKNMFVKNTTTKDIGPIAFEGYEFTIPANAVCSIYNSAGTDFTTRLFKIEATDPEVDGGAPVPPLMEVSAKDWDGKSYAIVSRFKVDHTRIPNRNDLLRIAKARGVSKKFLEECTLEDSDIDNERIAEEINNLPIPDKVRFADKKPAKE